MAASDMWMSPFGAPFCSSFGANCHKAMPRIDSAPTPGWWRPCTSGVTRSWTPARIRSSSPASRGTTTRRGRAGTSPSCRAGTTAPTRPGRRFPAAASCRPALRPTPLRHRRPARPSAAAAPTRLGCGRETATGASAPSRRGCGKHPRRGRRPQPWHRSARPPSFRARSAGTCRSRSAGCHQQGRDPLDRSNAGRAKSRRRRSHSRP